MKIYSYFWNYDGNIYPTNWSEMYKTYKVNTQCKESYKQWKNNLLNCGRLIREIEC